jgi:hypothetical protein
MSDMSGGTSKCILLSGPVTVKEGENINYSNDTDSTLYLKNIHPSDPVVIQNDQLIFTDRVFIYKDSLPLRYWIRDQIATISNENTLTVFPGSQYLLPFFPLHAINSGNMVGYYSLNPLKSPYNDKGVVKVSPPGHNLDLPESWEGKNIYVIYIK